MSGWLIRINVWQLRNVLRSLRRGELVGNLLFLVLLAVFFYSGYDLFLRLFTNLNEIGGLAQLGPGAPGLAGVLAFRTISMILLAFMVLLLFSNAVTALACLYLARDIDLLLAQPVSYRVLYAYKYLQATFHSSWMVLIFGGPVLAAYGSSVGAPVFYYPAALLLLIPFSFIAAAPGVLLVNLVMHFVPLARLRLVLVGIGLTFGGLLLAVFRALSPRRLFDPLLFLDPPAYLAALGIPATPWLPNHFAAQAVTAWAHGRPAWGPLLAVLGLAVGLSALAVGLGGKLYFRGLASGNRGDNAGTDVRCRVRGGSVRGVLMAKEVVYFLREPTQWSQLAVLLALLVVHLVNIGDLPLGIPLLHNFISFINLGLIGAVLAAVAVRFIFPAISLEGEGFWVTATAPVRLRDLYWSKFHVHFWPLMFGAQLLTACANWTLRADPLYWGLSFALVALMSATLTVLGLLLGTLFPKFNYNHVSDIATSPGGMMYMIVALGYVGLTMGVIVMPVYAHLFTALGWPELLRLLVRPLAALALLNAALLAGSVWWNRHALDRLACRA